MAESGAIPSSTTEKYVTDYRCQIVPVTKFENSWKDIPAMESAVVALASPGHPHRGRIQNRRAFVISQQRSGNTRFPAIFAQKATSRRVGPDPGSAAIPMHRTGCFYLVISLFRYSVIPLFQDVSVSLWRTTGSPDSSACPARVKRIPHGRLQEKSSAPIHETGAESMNDSSFLSGWPLPTVTIRDWGWRCRRLPPLRSS